MEEQKKIPCVIMRAGTSKGLFIKSNHLPQDSGQRDKVIMAIFGSPDVRQINGLGGADPLTSKLAIVGPSTHPDADVDYTFVQVGIQQPVLDYSGNCGNISSGVGPFAIDEGFVRAEEPTTTVRIHNTNTGKILVAEVEVQNGRARVCGDCAIAGVPGKGSEIMLNFAGTSGSVTGKLLPTSNVVDICEYSGGSIEASLVDCANPMVFVRSADLGLTGTESPSEIDGDPALLEKLEEIRSWAAWKMAMVDSAADATAKSPAFPMIAMVSASTDYCSYTTGEEIQRRDLSLVSRLMFMQVMHKTYAGTGTICTGVSARIPGTIVNEMVQDSGSSETINIGHPAGIISIEVNVTDGEVERAAISRTARRIMDGQVYIPAEALQG